MKIILLHGGNFSNNNNILKKNVKIKKFFKGFIPRAKVSVVYNVVFCNVYAGMLVYAWYVKYP